MLTAFPEAWCNLANIVVSYSKSSESAETLLGVASLLSGVIDVQNVAGLKRTWLHTQINLLRYSSFTRQTTTREIGSVLVICLGRISL